MSEKVDLFNQGYMTTIILLNCILTIIITIREGSVRAGNEILTIYWTEKFPFNISLPLAPLCISSTAKSDEPSKNAIFMEDMVTNIPGRPN